MRHHNANRKFGRTTKQRKALLRSLAGALIEHGSIVTTEAKAKELRGFIEPLITRGKTDSVANRRIIIARLGTTNTTLAKKLIETIAPQYKERAGGYTRVVKMGFRPGDAATKAIIEFV